MADNAIEIIREAERDAEKALREAAREGEQIREDARAQAAQAGRLAQEAADAKAADAIDAARQNSLQAMHREDERLEEELAALRLHADGRREQAVETVIASLI